MHAERCLLAAAAVLAASCRHDLPAAHRVPPAVGAPSIESAEGSATGALLQVVHALGAGTDTSTVTYTIQPYSGTGCGSDAGTPSPAITYATASAGGRDGSTEQPLQLAFSQTSGGMLWFTVTATQKQGSVTNTDTSACIGPVAVGEGGMRRAVALAWCQWLPPGQGCNACGGGVPVRQPCSLAPPRLLQAPWTLPS